MVVKSRGLCAAALWNQEEVRARELMGTAVRETAFKGREQLFTIEVGINHPGDKTLIGTLRTVAALEYISECIQEAVISPIATVALVAPHH